MKSRKKIKIKRKVVIFIIIIILCIVGYKLYQKYKEDNMKYTANLYFSDLDNTKEIGKTKKEILYTKNCSHVIEYPLIGNKEIDKKITSIINSKKKLFVEEYESDDIKEIIDIEYYQYINYETYLGPDDTMSLILFEAIEVGDLSTVSNKVYVYNFSLETGEILKDSYFFVGKWKETINNYLDSYLNKKNKYKDILFDDYKSTINKNIKYAITNDNIKIYFDKGEILPEYLNIIKIDIPYKEIDKYMDIDTKNKTKKPKINAGANVEKAIYTTVNKNMYVKSLVNILAKDNKNSRKLGELNKGKVVKVVSQSDTGWSKIYYNKKNCYVSSSYLSDESIAIEGYKEVSEKVYAIANVKVRESDNISSKTLGTLNFKESVTRIGVGDGWSEVLYNDKIAYINSSYLSIVEPHDKTISIKVDPQRDIDSSKPMVALTFDDGPNPNSTTRILNTLEKYNAVATFFDLGNLVYTYPKIVQREEAIGCEIGSHTYSHYNLNKLSSNEIQSEIDKSDKAFLSVLGHKPTLLRPPYGSANDTVKQEIPYALINWDIDTEDWKSRNKDAIISKIHDYSDYNGRIILMHSIYQTTADAVEVIVPELISNGYQLVTISELAKYTNSTLEQGKIYYNFR